MIISVPLEKYGYDITLKRGSIAKAGEIFNLGRKVLVVTDSGVPPRYAKVVCELCKTPVLVVIDQGEGSKNLETFEKLCKVMLENDFNRKDCVIAVGGGVVGDLAGFAAACFMRGIDFYNIPTTLLSQVDSSVGGKTAVDFCGIKNIIGAFHQPKSVLIDPDVLDTLPQRQFACGAAEAIKMAMTSDRELFELIESGGVKANVEAVIARALKIKAKVVSEDEKESGLRRVLNFGHTLGHGIESVTELLHGECVALGMIPMTGKQLRPRLIETLKSEGLPTESKNSSCEIVEAAMHDKKAQEGSIVTVRVEEIGRYEFVNADREKLLKDYEEVFR